MPKDAHATHENIDNTGVEAQRVIRKHHKIGIEPGTKRPDPIANPGQKAIDAALYPVTSDFLYFVSKNDGTHEFTKTFADHDKAVRRFQKSRAARKGKSWRDLKKRKDK